MNREIIAFLTGPADAKKRSEKDFSIYEAKDGRSYAIVILEGFVDEESNTLYESEACAVFGSKEFLDKSLAIGRKLHTS